MKQSSKSNMISYVYLLEAEGYHYLSVVFCVYDWYRGGVHI